MRVMPSVGSGRYWPGPGMAWLLEEKFYQDLRGNVAFCSQKMPDNRAIDSIFLRIRPNTKTPARNYPEFTYHEASYPEDFEPGAGLFNRAPGGSKDCG